MGSNGVGETVGVALVEREGSTLAMLVAVGTMASSEEVVTVVVLGNKVDTNEDVGVAVVSIDGDTKVGVVITEVNDKVETTVDSVTVTIG